MPHSLPALCTMTTTTTSAIAPRVIGDQLGCCTVHIWSRGRCCDIPPLASCFCPQFRSSQGPRAAPRIVLFACFEIRPTIPIALVKTVVVATIPPPQQLLPSRSLFCVGTLSLDPTFCPYVLSNFHLF